MKAREEKGFYFLFISRGPFYVMNLAVLFPVVLDIAKFHRNSDGYINILGINLLPSTYVILINTITGLLIMILCPIVGVISDSKNNRKKIVQWLVIVFFLAILFSFTIVFYNCWFMIGLIQIITLTIFELLNPIFNSFIGEIGENSEDYNKLSSFSTFWENLSMILYLAISYFIFRSNVSSNLINRGNFDYDSLKQWKIFEGNDLLTCNGKEVSSGRDPDCWESTLVGGLNIYIPGKKMIMLYQEDSIKNFKKGLYAFSTYIKTNKNVNASSKLLVIQNDADGKVIRESKSEYYTLHEKKKNFLKVPFKINERTKSIDFQMIIKSEKDDSFDVILAETVMPVEKEQLFSIYLSGTLFTLISFIGSRLFQNRQGEDLSRSFIKNGLKEILGIFSLWKDKLMVLLFLLVNAFWFGGYTMWVVLSIIYLEDKYTIGSYIFVIIFSVICLSSMLGAIINYYLVENIGKWYAAQIFFAIWIFIPFSVLLKPLSVPLFVYIIIFIIVGISLGSVSSLRFSIFTDLIPEKEEGKYMSILYFSCKFMDLLTNIFILMVIRFLRLEILTCLSSILFGISFVILNVIIFVVLRKKQNNNITVVNNEDRKSSEDKINLDFD